MWYFVCRPSVSPGLSAIVLCAAKGAKLVTHIQDLQVDAAKDLGMIRTNVF